ncbi:MAG: polyprenyl diphosphate synthase [Gammaproteobacteria bacterium]
MRERQPIATRAPRDRSGPPRHIAIIMDGNGRWAERRRLPRIAGHRAGVAAARGVVHACAERGVEVLTLFAFSSENWRRPQREVGLLMELFMTSLQEEASRLDEHDVRVRFIGDQSLFPTQLRKAIAEAENVTRHNHGLMLIVAANYGGRWDLTQAARALAKRAAAGDLDPEAIDEALLVAELCLYGLPEPDLFVRTGGEQRISNFLLWQLAYTELYFAECMWPDFGPAELEDALHAFGTRQRRFGRTSDQLEPAKHA